MKPLKALKGTIKNLDNFQLHILLTQEDDVIVARCLDFSVSSHGLDEKEALYSLTDSIKDYLNYAFEAEAFDNIIDPDEKIFWEVYRKLELQNEMITFHKMADSFRKENIREIAYA
ncbi:MAG: hypothetical protein ABFS56_16610 [Pseudomonadota bacterium]